jgi:4-diphosphocytidyl-2-C-methyl-D-erythritol kinase
MVFLHKIRYMITFPQAKINIGLRVTGIRRDGYHDIETIFYPLGLCDALEFVVPQDKVKEDKLVVTGINIGLRTEKNLVIAAVRKMRENYPVPFLKIHLHKAIPSGAGLGGGSSDAASMIKAINKLFSFNIDNSELKGIAFKVGSDCPFFIDPVPSYATGRGEVLKPVSIQLDGFHIVLVNPGIHISTREVYNNCIPAKPAKSLEKLISLHASQWKKFIVNDFEDYVYNLHPGIEEIKKILYHAGAVYTSMSGSGSTVYGIFDRKPEIPEKLREFVIYENKL